MLYTEISVSARLFKVNVHKRTPPIGSSRCHKQCDCINNASCDDYKSIALARIICVGDHSLKVTRLRHTVRGGGLYSSTFDVLQVQGTHDESPRGPFRTAGIDDEYRQ